MFNFFDEIVGDFGLEVEKINQFNVINMSNKLLYVEGQRGIFCLTDENISLRVKGGVLQVNGIGLKLKRISKTTLVITGNIKSIESV